MNKVLILLALILCSLNVSATITLHETADQSYADGWINSNLINDGNYETASALYKADGICSTTNNVSHFYENLSMTTWTVNGNYTPLIQIKYSNYSIVFTNLTLKESCWAWSKTNNIIMIDTQSYYQDGYGVGIRVKCYSGSWEQITESNDGMCRTTGPSMYLYETAIIVDQNSTGGGTTTGTNNYCVTTDAYYLSGSAGATTNYTIFNLSGLTTYVAANMSNLRILGEPYKLGNDTIVLNTSQNKSYTIYVSDSTVNITYNTTTITGINETSNKTIANFIQLNNFYDINYYNENASNWNKQYPINLTIYCDEGKITKEQPTNNYKLVTTIAPQQLRINVSNSNNTYYRDIKPVADSSINFYLFDSSIDKPTLYSFTYFEYTRSFVSPYIEIRKTISNTQTLITRTPFDYSGTAHIYLVGDSYYNLTIADNSHSYQIGNQYITPNQTSQTFYVTSNTFIDENVNITYYFDTNKTTKSLSFYYNDPLQKTTQIKFYVYNRSKNYYAPPQIYNITVNSSSTLVNYTYPNTTTDRILLVATINHSTYGLFNLSIETNLRPEGYTNLIPLGSLPDKILGLSRSNWLILLSLAAIILPLLIFNLRHASTGLLLSAMATLFTSIILNWIPLALPITLLIIVFAVLYKMREGRYVT